MKRNKIIIGTIIALVILVGGSIAGYSIYKNNQITKQITICKANIDKEYSAFENEKDNTKKLDILKSTISKSNEYKNKDKFDDVYKDYNDKISEMKKYFTDDYEDIIKKNSLNDITKEADIKKISDAKNNLEKLSETISNEKDTVLDGNNKYEDQINKLIKSYNERIESIKEENKQKEIEKNKVEESQRNEVQNNNDKSNKSNQVSSNNKSSDKITNSNNKTVNKSNNIQQKSSSNIKSHKSSSDGSKNSGGSSNGGEYRWSLDKNGNKVDSSVIHDDGQGHITGSDGNKMDLKDYFDEFPR